MSRVIHTALHQFSAGVSNSPNSAIPLPFPTPGQQGWKWLYESFATGHLYTTSSNPYNETQTNGAAAVGANGALLSNTGADNDLTLLQWTTPTAQIGASTKKFYLETSVILTAATMADNEMFVGFTSDQQGNDFVLANGLGWTFDDGFGFGKLDTDTELSFISGQSEAASAHQIVGLNSTLTTATTTKLGCFYDGTTFFLFKDDVFVASATRATLNDDAPMGVSCFVKCGKAEAQTLLVHYVALGTEL